MSRSSFLRQMKELVRDFSENGKILDYPVGRVGAKNLSSDTLKVLRKFISLLLCSNMLSEETKLYIKNLDYTQKDIKVEMFNLYGVELNQNTIQSKLWNDKGKIERLIGSDIILDLVEYKKEFLLGEYECKIDSALDKYCEDREIDNLVLLKLPKDKGELLEVDSTSFGNTLKILGVYSKEKKKKAESALDLRSLKYIRYLLGKSDEDLSSKCRNDKEKVRQALGI